ncbi:hypothetical protein M569_15185 [Genlisea aurea]|uniref:Uncharacterized protein n=1 Tax=Genlisea aurea TaxID=192259 RepID=S8DAA8_9LAMI|nr:hypothetical protein M569_15185 [Genlisea aurea]
MAEQIKSAAGEGSWSVGLFDCITDLELREFLFHSVTCDGGGGLRCLDGGLSAGFMSCFCPCVTFGQISEIVDRGSSSCVLNGALYAWIRHTTCLACCYSCCYRTKLRHQYSIPGSSCGDCCAHFCCEPCALRQEYRELQNRGFDVSLGWEGNLERREKNHREIQISPPVIGDMMERRENQN